MFIDRVGFDLKVLSPYDGFEQFINLQGDFSFGAADAAIPAELTVLLKDRVSDPGTKPWMTISAGSMIRCSMEGLNECDTVENILSLMSVEEFTEDENEQGHYESLKDIETYLADRNIQSRIYVNRQKKRTIVLVKDMTPSSYHVMGAFVSRLLPWYFEDAPLTQEERELARAMTKRDPSDFYRMIERLTEERFSFREEIIHAAMDDYKEKYFSIHRERINNEIEHLYQGISEAEETIRYKRREILQKTITLNGLNADEDSKELLEFILGCKSISIADFRGEDITFDIKTTLSNYNRDDAEACVMNPNAYIYDYRNGFTAEEAQKLLIAIFIEERFAVKMYAQIRANLVAGTMAAVAGFIDMPGYMSNQHIKQHHCLGGNGEAIMAALNAGNDIGALNAMIASVANINVSEEVSNRYFFEILFSTKEKVLVDYDGNEYTPEEAIALLEGENA